MLQAYLGIVSSRGLEVFCPEHPQTARFLWRRARRTEGGALCFWAVITTEMAANLDVALRRGLSQTALEYLYETAHDFGFLAAEDQLAPDLATYCSI